MLLLPFRVRRNPVQLCSTFPTACQKQNPLTAERWESAPENQESWQTLVATSVPSTQALLSNSKHTAHFPTRRWLPRSLDQCRPSSLLYSSWSPRLTPSMRELATFPASAKYFKPLEYVYSALQCESLLRTNLLLSTSSSSQNPPSAKRKKPSSTKLPPAYPICWASRRTTSKDLPVARKY